MSLAYTQGTEIHVAPGQEKHLPHEVWHVVQQQEGRVKPTIQIQNANINDDENLEREADKVANLVASSIIMQQRKTVIHHSSDQSNHQFKTQTSTQRSLQSTSENTLQRKPNDIKSSHVLSVDASGAVTNRAAQRDQVSVAYPINILLTNQLITNRGETALGGHLFKAEYGGQDSIENVVPWNPATEKKYATFEASYLREAKKGAEKTKGDYSVSIETEAKFKPNKEAGSQVRSLLKEDIDPDNDLKRTMIFLIQRSLESVPTAIKAKTESGDSRFTRTEDEILVSRKNEINLGKVKSTYEDWKQNGLSTDIQKAKDKLCEWESF